MSVKIYETHKQHGQHLVMAPVNVYGARHPEKIMVKEFHIELTSTRLSKREIILLACVCYNG